MSSKNKIKLFFMCAFLLSLFNLNAQDWPNLQRYQAENAALTAPAKGEKRVVFMGNSITQGWKGSHPDFFLKNPYRITSYNVCYTKLLRVAEMLAAFAPAASHVVFTAPRSKYGFFKKKSG